MIGSNVGVQEGDEVGEEVGSRLSIEGEEDVFTVGDGADCAESDGGLGRADGFCVSSVEAGRFSSKISPRI